MTLKEEEFLLLKISTKKYKKEAYLLKEGEICRYLSFVLSGCLKTFYLDKKGNEHIVSFDIENYWTGDLSSFINQMPANFNLQCIENSELIHITNENMEILYKEIPSLERFFRILIQNAYISSEMRVINNFRLTAKKRYLKFIKNHPTIEKRVPQYMVASYLGITPEFLSKTKRKLSSRN